MLVWLDTGDEGGGGGPSEMTLKVCVQSQKMD